MFSTSEGARKRAKELKRRLDASGFDYPLNRCQKAVAIAAGHRDWHDLNAALDGKRIEVDAHRYARRLLQCLPVPCRATANGMLDGVPLPEIRDENTPPRWWHDVFPYVFSIAVIHRSQTAVIRKGSGPGQKLREDIVLGLLMNRHGGSFALPLLDPESLTLVYRGDHPTLFKSDFRRPGFAAELGNLVRAGVIELRTGEVRIVAPDRDAVKEHALGGWIQKAGSGSLDSAGLALEAFRDVLAMIGVREALQVADAAMQFGSDAFDRPAGALLDLLSRLAEQGELDVFAEVVRIFEMMHPESSRSIRSSVPVKIVSRYLGGNLSLSASHILAYDASEPGWRERLQNDASDPVRFVETVRSVAAGIETMGQ